MKLISLLLSLGLTTINPGISAWAQVEVNNRASALAETIHTVPQVTATLLRNAGVDPSFNPLTQLSAVQPLSAPGLQAAPDFTPRPVIKILEKLREAGVDLTGTLKSSTAAKRLLDNIQILPAGPARDSIQAFARIIAAPNAGGVSADIGRIFDNSSSVDGKTKGVPAPIPADQLRWTPDLKLIPNSTRDIPSGHYRSVGQKSAEDSVEFALRMALEKGPKMALEKGPNRYNLYASGPEGSDSEDVVIRQATRIARGKKVPPDLVTATNFTQPDEPIFLDLPPGRGALFQKGLKDLIAILKMEIPGLFNAPEFVDAKQKAIQAIQEKYGKRIRELVAKVSKIQLTKHLYLSIQEVQTPDGQIRVFMTPTFEGEALDDKLAQSLIKDGKLTLKEWEKAEKATEGNRPNVFLNEYTNIVKEQLNAISQTRKKQVEEESLAAAKLIYNRGQFLYTIALPGLQQRVDMRIAQESKRLKSRFSRTKISRDLELRAELKTGKQILVHVEVFYQGKRVNQAQLEKLSKAGKISREDFGTLFSKTVEVMSDYHNSYLKLLRTVQEDEKRKLIKEGTAHKPIESYVKTAAYIGSLLQRMAENYEDFFPPTPEEASASNLLSKSKDPAELYRIDIQQDNGGRKGAPVVEARTPTRNKIAGYVKDSSSRFRSGSSPGGEIIKGGYLHEARGGILIAWIADVLKQPGAFEAIMKTVIDRVIETYSGDWSPRSTDNGAIHTVDADVEVVFIGSSLFFHLLHHYDEDFRHYFKGLAQFEYTFPISNKIIKEYLRFFKQIVKKSGGKIRELSQGAMAAVLEELAVAVDSNREISAQRSIAENLILDATYWADRRIEAESRGRHTQQARLNPDILREDVEEAVRKAHAREDQAERETKKANIDDIFPLGKGRLVGQMHGLTVLDDGIHEFGKAVRVTANAFNSFKPNIISADRDADITGKNFNKASNIVTAFLKWRLAQDFPFTSEVSVAFEQVYGGIDGDSASLVETMSIMSALSDIPIRQDLAATGSMDQKGMAQVIGGINQKIPGFLDIVKAKGWLNKKNPYAIIMPAASASELALRKDIQDLVRTGLVRIYPVTTIEEAWEIATGTKFAEAEQKAKKKLKEYRSRMSLPNAPEDQ